MNYEINDFENDVIKRSADIPVLVDFWAEWCGPCKILGPILERLVEESDNRWILAKIDTDKYQDLAARYGIRGIPNVKLFVDGSEVNEFTGALPEPAIVQWLHKALPNKFRKTIELAERLLSEGDMVQAQSLLAGIVQQDSANEHARVTLAGCLFSTNPEQAASLVDGIEEDSEYFPKADAIRTFGALASKASTPDLLPDDPVKPVYLQALRELSGLHYDAAVEKFIDVLRTNRSYDDDGARKACIAIFRILGDDHAVTQQRRREFSSALYA